VAEELLAFREGLYSVGLVSYVVGAYRVADKSLARRTSRYILFDRENISFDGSLVIHI
jgi:hypothetical protein